MREVYPDLDIKVIGHGIRGPELIRQAADKLRSKRPGDGKIRFGMIVTFCR